MVGLRLDQTTEQKRVANHVKILYCTCGTVICAGAGRLAALAVADWQWSLLFLCAVAEVYPMIKQQLRKTLCAKREKGEKQTSSVNNFLRRKLSQNGLNIHDYILKVL